ncbi:MAG: hypothetical protein CMG55_10525 [Candidatus Marinimicrobia bacterium]|nr:hypothetical protein [Candidatus Neomarinimicrobiota bacterium]
MVYIKYLKDIVIFFVLIISLFSIRLQQSELKKIKIELENTKNNLFQTNEIVGMMQKKLTIMTTSK